MGHRRCLDTPAGLGRWLESLTVPLHANSSLAGTYSRQIAYDEAPPHQRFYIDFRFGPEARIQEASSPEELTVVLIVIAPVLRSGG